MDAKQALADRLKQANNILVTVSNNPSVDQLASCIGLTLALNKLNKHATAVFSGEVPNTIEFLSPEKTIEKNTDSLRDFIISLDKAKADKLRYKVEDKVVKIFITPYKTSISDKDLEFSQGDFNVDAVVAIGVHNQADLDQAITSHGRILHDATLTTINVNPGGEFGTINWLEPKASSLSELAAELVIDGFGHEVLDEQMATAFLTGIVAETKRFSNEKTIPATMTISAELMAAGANQQLVATKLEPKPVAPPPAPAPAPFTALQSNGSDAPMAPPIQALPAAPPKPDDGTLEISHNTDVSALETPEPEEPEETPLAQIHIDDQGSLRNLRDQDPGQVNELPRPMGNTDPTKHMEAQHMIMQPPTMGGQLTASGVSDEDEERPAGDPLNPVGAPPTGLLQRSAPIAPPPPDPGLPSMPMASDSFGQPAVPSQPQADPFTLQIPPNPPQPLTPPVSLPPLPPQPPVAAPQPLTPPPAPAPAPLPDPSGQTLTELEQNVHSPHLQSAPASPSPATPNPSDDLDSARNAVMQAIAGQAPVAGPIQALNAQPLGDPLRPQVVAPAPDSTAPPQVPPPMLPPTQPV